MGIIQVDLDQHRSAIGGEFELDGIPTNAASRLSELTRGMEGTWTASGRSALGLVLEHLRTLGVEHLHLPAYLCDSVLQPVKSLGLNYSFYPVGADLTAEPDPPPGSAVLLIHYFGWMNQSTARLRSEAGRSFFLIEDTSHALLSDWHFSPKSSSLVFFSARKFGPAVLGGWCNLPCSTSRPSSDIEALAWRSLAARLVRGAYLSQPDSPIESHTESFCLAAFEAMEAFLNRNPINTDVPQLGLDIIAGYDWHRTKARRRVNWLYLKDLLTSSSLEPISELQAGVVPLAYVLGVKHRDFIRSRLSNERIFCPVHWRLPDEVNPRRFPEAAKLAASCLSIPIDQRYGTSDMNRIATSLGDACSIKP